MSKDKDRDAILAAGQEVFARQGVDQTTLEDIAKEAKLDLKKVKALFPDTQSVLDEIIQRELDETSELFTKVVSDRGKADIKLTCLVRDLLTRYQKGFSLFHLVSNCMEHATQDDELIKCRVKPEHLDRYRQNTAILGRLIAQGQSENLFTDVDPLEAAYLLRGMIRSALLYRRVAKREDDMRDQADVVMRIFLKGLLR